jgi:branched-chain amino acid transport system permease protein
LFWQLVVNGIAVGSIYGLVALGLVLVYKTTEVLNFAQGELGMAATFLAYGMISAFGLPFPVAFAGACLFGFVLGVLIEFLFLRRADNPTLLGLIVITLGCEMILYGLASHFGGTDTKAFPSPISDIKVYHFGNVVVSQLNLVIMVVSVALMAGLFCFFKFSTVGVAMRAVAQNEDAAKVMGIKVSRIKALTWGIASMLGAVAAILIAPITLLDPNMMLDPLLKAFASAVLGGMESLPGAAVGGWILGIVENLVGGYLSTEFKTTVAFVIIVIVLTIRPSGLLGRHYKKKV